MEAEGGFSEPGVKDTQEEEPQPCGRPEGCFSDRQGPRDGRAWPVGGSMVRATLDDPSGEGQHQPLPASQPRSACPSRPAHLQGSTKGPVTSQL